MSRAERKTPASVVRDFRVRHGLTQPALDRLLGFSSEGAAVRRWERENGPYYACIIFTLVDTYGIDLMKELADAGLARRTRHEVMAFRERHRLTSEATDRLFGFASNGRATRRWEEPLEKGAPTYVTVMMAYADKYGLSKLETIADGCR